MGRVGGGLLSIGDQIVYRPPSFIGLQPTTWMVRRMYKVDVYLRVRRAVMVEGMSIRETARTFGLHRDTVRKCWPIRSRRVIADSLRLESPS